MRLLIYIVVGVVAGIVLLVGVIALIGLRLPKTHTASRSILLHQTPAQVYAVVRDFESTPKWRSDVESVSVHPGPNGRLQLREQGKNGIVNYELTEDVPNQRLATQILDTDLGYSGKWTYVLIPENENTRVTITEDGEVSNVFFRFMSRYVFGHTATMDTYLTSLAKRFGESATPN